MRIVGGTLRGRRLSHVTNPQLRPTTDRAREALFNVLNNRVDWSAVRVLDLFAGSGAISLECCSRGCSDVTAVERHPATCRELIRIVADWGVQGLSVRQQPVERFLSQVPSLYDLIFLDPPYAYADKAGLVQRLVTAWLAKDGTVVLEHPVQETFEEIPGHEERRAYGQSVFSFFCKPD